MSEDEADSEASRATLRNSVLAHSPSATAHTRPAHAGPSRAVRGGAPEAWARVGLPEEEEEDDESMVIAMKYLGDPAFRQGHRRCKTPLRCAMTLPDMRRSANRQMLRVYVQGSHVTVPCVPPLLQESVAGHWRLGDARLS